MMYEGRKKRFRKPKPKSEYDSKLLDLSRVTRVTAGGKQLRFRAVVVIGNHKGKENSIQIVVLLPRLSIW